MAVNAWAQALSIEQSFDILRQCSLFKSINIANNSFI